MSGYKEQGSRQGSRRRARQVQSVPPSSRGEREKSRSLDLSSSLRVSVQPPVCGVQPGKVLELRTTLGLMRARALIEQQVELERQQTAESEGGLRGGGLADGEKQAATTGKLKHGRLQPLGVASDPMRISSSCLGIVSVNNQLPEDRRPRSCTVPAMTFGNPDSTTPRKVRGNDSGRREKRRSRSYTAAVTPNNVQIERLKELAAGLSITKTTGLMPKEEPRTNASAEKVEKDCNGGDGRKSTKESQNHAPSHTEGTLDDTQPPSTDRDMQHTAVDTIGNIQMLPPVVRHGELGMKVEVKGLKVMKDLASSNVNQSSTGMTVSSREHILESSNSMIDPQMRRKAEKSPYFMSQSSTTTDERLNRTMPRTRSGESKSNPSSPKKVSIVSLGETQLVRPKIRLRRRRHSEGRQLGSGRLSRGWSPPQTIEPLVGSPLHTPRRPSQSATVRGGSWMSKVKGDEGQANEFESVRSSMTSPGLMINVDVNEFLRDIDTDNP